MKLVLISDTHGERIKALPKGDVLIHSGDWSNYGTYKDTRYFICWMQEVRHKYKEILCVPGNHDRWVESNIQQAKQEFKDSGLNLLIDEEFNLDNIKFYGHPWTPIFCNWAFMANDERRKQYCDNIPSDVDVLISHGPPKNFMDELDGYGSNPGEHVGCEFLYNKISREKIKLVTFGHIHEGTGIQRYGETLLVNASHMDSRYNPVNGFKVVYL